MKIFLKSHGPAILLLALAAILRLYLLNQKYYSYDEMGALSKSLTSSFSALLQLSILPDGHPPLVQSWLWLSFAPSQNIFWVRFPFVLCGIASLLFFYLATARQTSKFTALMILALLSVAEPVVSAHQLIRPYSPAFLGVAWLFYTLTLPTSRSWQWVPLTLSSLLCFYSHHFGALQALLLWICFFPFSSAHHKKILYWSLLLISLLSLPLIPITLHQLQHKGLSWLSVPSPSFLLQLGLKWTHRHGGFAIFILLPIILAFLPWPRKVAKKWGAFFLCGIAPLGILWIYSALRAPVLQPSALLFSLPFLFIALFYTSKPMALSISLFCSGFTAFFGTYSLTGLHYFQIGYTSIFKESWSWLQKPHLPKLIWDLPPDLESFMTKVYPAPASSPIDPNLPINVQIPIACAFPTGSNPNILAKLLMERGRINPSKSITTNMGSIYVFDAVPSMLQNPPGNLCPSLPSKFLSAPIRMAKPIPIKDLMHQSESSLLVFAYVDAQSPHPHLKFIARTGNPLQSPDFKWSHFSSIPHQPASSYAFLWLPLPEISAAKAPNAVISLEVEHPESLSHQQVTFSFVTLPYNPFAYGVNPP